MKKIISTLWCGLMLSALLIMNALAQGNVLTATDGDDLVTKMQAAGSGDRIMLTGTYYELSSPLTVKNGVKIIGTQATHGSVITVLSGGQIIMDSNSEIWNCKITREIPTTGSPSISLATTTSGQNIRIENCFFEKNRTAIYINPGAVNLQINKNKFDDNRTGIVVPGGAGNNITGLQITGNTISGNRTFGVIFTSAQPTADFSIDATFTANNIVGNLACGIGIDNNNTNTSIKLRNNWFGTPSPAIFTQTLNNPGAFQVQDHTEGYENNAAFTFHINYQSGQPYYISGAHTDKIQKTPAALPDILHATAALPDHTASFVPVAIGSSAYYTTIQDAINNADAGDVIHVPDGIYDEDVNVNKAVTVTGASQENTIIRGLFTGDVNTVQVGAGATLSNLTVTRDYGTTVYEWTSASKSQGITLTGNGATIDGVKVTGNRNGIYVNNRQNFTITNNLVTNNRTGFQIVNNLSGGIITNNHIADNFTHGLMLNFVNGPVNAENLKIRYNSFSDNWYSEIYFHGSNAGTFTNADFTCNNFNTTAISKLATAAGEPDYDYQLPPHLGGVRPAAPAHILKGTKVNDLKHAPWLNNYDDANTSLAGYQIPAEYTVGPVSGTLSASNNNFRILANAIGCAVDGDKITLNGTFDYNEPNALDEWAKGIDGDATTTDDNYAINISKELKGIELTASSLGSAKIIGPGDISSANLESFLSLRGTDNSDWKISNLEISGFDASIAFLNAATWAHNTVIFNNTISVPADNTNDINQNIGLHLTKGTNQKIHHNTIYLDGMGVGVDAATKSTSVALQSYSSGAQHTDGLEIHDNEIIVTGQPDPAEPAYIIGIWENAGSTNAAVSIYNNKFSNADAGNLPENNRQLAFRVTSRSGAAKEVVYHNNEITGFNRAIDWLGDPFGSYAAAAYNTGAGPVIIRHNKIDNVQFGITPRKAPASTNPGAPAMINNNSFTNIIEGGYAVGYSDGGELDASCNYWDTAIAADVKQYTSGTGNIRVMKFLNDGGSDATVGFSPTGDCVAPVRRVTPEEFFASIQEGIDDDETGTGSELQVEPGNYEHTATVLVNKSVKISGTGATQPALSFKSGAAITNKAHFYVTAPDVTISNFTINVAGTGDDMIGILAGNAGTYNNLTISDNVIANLSATADWNSYGILAGSLESNGVDKVTITDNTIGAFGRGIRLMRVNGEVTDNTIDAIHALSTSVYSAGDNMSVSGNHFHGSVNMVESNGSDKELTVTGNFFDAAQATTDAPFYLLQIRENSNVTPTTISGNQFHNHTRFGVFVARSGNVTLDENEFTPSGSAYTNIAWNSKSETSSTNPVPLAAEKFYVTGNTFNGSGGKDLSFANHNAGAVPPLSDIQIGSDSKPNHFGTPAYYVYLDSQSGSTDNESGQLWTNNNPFSSAKPTTMAPFAEFVYVGNNTFNGPSVAASLPFSAIADIENLIWDKDDESTLGQVYVQMPVRNTRDNNSLYLTIQEGINDAADNEELEVLPYTLDHSTTIQVNKPLTIKGQDNGSLRPILTGTGDATNKSRFFISASDVTIENLEIHVAQTGNDITGIKASNTDGALTLTNNVITGLSADAYPVWNSFGIDIGDRESGRFTNINMTGNTIGTFGRAARLTRTHGLVDQNTLEGTYALNAGAYSVGGDLTINDNDFTGSVNMVESASTGGQLAITNNAFEPILEGENKTSFYLLQIRENKNNKPAVVSGNHFNNHKAFGVFVARSGNVTIDGNTFNPDGTDFTNIAWNSKSESSATFAPFAAEGFTVINNTLNGSGGTGISFANHNAGGVVPLSDIKIGTSGNLNHFGNDLGKYIVLDHNSGPDAKSIFPWNTAYFSSTSQSTMAPFAVDFFVPYNTFGETGIGNVLSYSQIATVENKITDKDDDATLGQVFIKAPVKNTDLGTFYMAIQPAIDAADDNNHIEVEPITFDHATTILVNKPLHIQGLADPDATRPVLTGTGDATNKSRFFVTAQDVTIDNFEIQVAQTGNDITGIKASNTGGALTLTNNVITGLSADAHPVWNSFGIDVGDQESHSFTAINMTGNTIGTFGRAARLTRTHGTVTGNTLTGTYALNGGAYNAGGALTINDNNFAGAVNMVASGSANDTDQLVIDDNDFVPITEAEGRESFYLLQVRDNDNDKPALVTGNRFKDHQHFGLFLGRSGNVTVEENTFTPKANATGFTHIAWNSKNESGTTNPAAYAAEKIVITDNTFNASGTTGGKAISFANHKSGAGIIPLKDITVGETAKPNNFAAGIQHYIYLDKQTGSSNSEAEALWTSPAFGSAMESTMAPFAENIYAGYNLFAGNTSQAYQLPKDDILSVELNITDKDDEPSVGQVFFRSVWNEDQDLHYATIQEAVNAADDGHKLIAYGWEYNEDVTVNKSVSITGDNLDETDKRPVVKNSSGTQRFLITRADVTIRNFRIEVSETGTDMTGIKAGTAGTYNNLTVKDNLIVNTATGAWGSYGIYTGTLSPSNAQDQITLQGNDIQNFGRAARLERVSGEITDNTFEGIYALNVAAYAVGGDLDLEHNKFYGSVSMIGSNANTNTLSITENIFDASLTDTDPFYLLQIRENGNPTPVNISGNEFLNHTHFGVFVARSGNVTLDDNVFTPNGNAFTNIAWNSKSETSSTGAQPFAADGFTVTNNTLNGTGGKGISFANHFAGDGIVPLTNINLGTTGNPNTFGADLASYIVLDHQSGSAKAIALWNSGAFASAGESTMAPFAVDIFGGNNQFGDGAAVASTLGFTAIQDIEGKVTDKDDEAVLGQVFFKTPVHNVTRTQSYQSIQAAVNEAVSGDIIQLDEWQYIETVTIATPGLTIEGNGNIAEIVLRPSVVCSGITTGPDGVTINAAGITLKDFTITQFRNGVVANGADITLNGIEALNNCYNGVSVRDGAHNLTITGSKLNANRYGLQAGTTVSANNMTIEDSEIKGNEHIGLIVENGNGSGTTFNNARLTNIDFSDNQEKGIYLEKANDLIMDGLLVDNCGTMNEQYLVNQGIDINLKFGNFSKVVLRNSTITNSGAPGHSSTHADAPAAISIKARNDGTTYSANPATLNDVLIENNIIHGIVHGLRIGEYGTTVNTGPTNVVIQNNAFTGSYTGKALTNTTSAIPNANCNWWGVTNLAAIQAKTSGTILITTFLGNGNNSVTTGVGFTPIANCNAGRADFTISFVTAGSSLQSGETTNILVRIENVSQLPQSGNIVFAVSKIEPNFSLAFDPAITQVTINSNNRNVQNSSSNLTVSDQTTRYLFTINAAQLITGGGTFNVALQLKANSSASTGNITGLISGASDDNGNNNSGNIIVISN